MILDGKKLSDEILDNIKKQEPQGKLAVITIGDDTASKVYVRNKQKACEKVGFEFENKVFTEYDTYESIVDYVSILNNSSSVYGIIIQLPIISKVLTDVQKKVICTLPSYSKNVDGFGRVNKYIPCTPKGIIRILDSINYNYRGKTALIIGRSDIVGKPIANLLLDRDCTVIQAHSKTNRDTLLRMFSYADLVISAVGRKDLITEEDAYQYFKDNRHDFYGDFKNKRDRVIIDVGINRNENGKLCGDFPEEFKQKYSSYYTPVPGGIGPMTVAMLIENVWESFKHGNNIQ